VRIKQFTAKPAEIAVEIKTKSLSPPAKESITIINDINRPPKNNLGKMARKNFAAPSCDSVLKTTGETTKTKKSIKPISTPLNTTKY